ncbi:MAG: FHA domain-containing protein [Gemmataceae bacterium]
MSIQGGPAAVGGLIVRNGKHRGTRVPLKLPVTVIGRGEGCDVRLNAEGIAPLHCVIAITPAGPTLRTWDSENTLVNQKPTAAAVLQNGDELKVGPCSFRVSWYGDLATAEPELPAVEQGSGDEWSMKEREAALHEQEIQLSALLEDKQKQVHELLTQLAAGREQFHAEKASIKDQLTVATASRREADQIRKAAEAARQKSHTTYRKLLARLKRQRMDWHREQAEGESKLSHAWKQYETARTAHEAERIAFVADAEKTKTRLQDAWHMLEEGQRRLLNDRKAAETIFAEYQQMLDQKYGALDAKEASVAEATARMEARCEGLLSEIAGLERRASHANLAVQELEQKRIVLEAEGIEVATNRPNTPARVNLLAEVPLDGRRDRSFDEVMNELLIRERELTSEHKAIGSAKAELVRLSNELTDQRSVLTEQFTKLATAARLWQQAEVATAGELEQLAATVDAREQSVALREHRLLKAEETNRMRERELWSFRVKLEGWQAGLTAHEAQWYSERDRAAAESDRKRDHLAQWESSLETLCRTWNELRVKEREALQAEIAAWAGERSEYVSARTALDHEAIRLAKQAKQCAALMTALESTAATVDEKKLRVMRKRWESHFARFEKLWESRHKAATKLASSLDARIAESKKQIAAVGRERAQLERDKQTWDANKLSRERIARENDQVYSLTVARAKRSDRELIELRSEVERIAGTLLAAGQATGEEITVALMPARAA